MSPPPCRLRMLGLLSPPNSLATPLPSTFLSVQPPSLPVRYSTSSAYPEDWLSSPISHNYWIVVTRCSPFRCIAVMMEIRRFGVRAKSEEHANWTTEMSQTNLYLLIRRRQFLLLIANDDHDDEQHIWHCHHPLLCCHILHSIVNGDHDDNN